MRQRVFGIDGPPGTRLIHVQWPHGCATVPESDRLTHINGPL